MGRYKTDKDLKIMKRFSIVTFGCKVNQFDSEMIMDQLIQSGYNYVKMEEKPDIFIINTCTVTHRADFQARQMIRRAYRCNPDALIIVTGCYSQVQPDLLGKMKEINYILGNKEKENIAELLPSIETGKLSRIYVSSIQQDNHQFDITVPFFYTHTRSFLKIQDGCNNRCSYCIVPFARGPSRSLTLEKVLNNMEILKKRGYLEVILTGINIGSYGIDLDKDLNLKKLLENLEDSETPKRIRLSSIEPFDLSSDLISMIAQSSKICHHLHVPIQSGDDEILKKMNRNYNRALISEMIFEINSKIPDISIGADLIAGFPGETEEMFRNTYELIEKLPISYLHVFPFSKRKGTLAEGLTPEVEPKEIKRRTEILRELGRKKRLQFYKKFLGKKLSVLGLESKGKDIEKWRGLSRNYIPVFLSEEDKVIEKSDWINREWTVKVIGMNDKGFLTVKRIGLK